MGERSSASPEGAGFTLLEVLFPLVLLGLVLVIAAPRVGAARQTPDSNRAVRTLALDLELALSLAARQRTAVEIEQPASTLQFVVQDAASGNVFLSRDFGDGSTATVDALTLAPTTVTVFPTGRTSGALTVTVVTGDRTRTLTMSQAGRIVVTP
jgi:type II secretory pathway pseudopilin PulG